MGLLLCYVVKPMVTCDAKWLANWTRNTLSSYGLSMMAFLVTSHICEFMSFLWNTYKSVLKLHCFHQRLGCWPDVFFITCWCSFPQLTAAIFWIILWNQCRNLTCVICRLTQVHNTSQSACSMCWSAQRFCWDLGNMSEPYVWGWGYAFYRINKIKKGKSQ